MSIVMFAMDGFVCRGFDGKPAVQSGDTGKGMIWASCKLACYDFHSGDTDYHEVTAYGKMADVLLMANERDHLFISGRIKNFKYEKRDGTTVYGKRFVAEKISLPSKREREGNKNYQPPTGVQDEEFKPKTKDDNLPF